MPRIPEYSVGIVRNRKVADTVNLSAISSAGATMRGISEAADFGNQMMQKYKDADDATALNEAVIAKQKADMEWIDEQRKNREGNPFDFAKDIEPELKKRDDEFSANLSGAAKRQWKPTADRINLQTYESNLNWENTRKTQIFASRIEKSIDDNNLMMLRAGMNGEDPEQFLKNIDAATVAASGVFSGDQLSKINTTGRSDGLSFYLRGMIGENPEKAKQLLDSKKYDSALGADKVLSLTDMAEKAAEQKREEAISAGMVFANIDDMQAMAGGNPKLQKQAAAYRNAVFSDPAGYVSNHPEISKMDALIQSIPDENQGPAIAERASKMIEIQNQMGVPSYRQSLVPMAMAKETAYAMSDPDTSPDQAMQQFNGYMQNFAGNEGDAIDQLKNAGLKGSPLSALLSMGNDTDRVGLMKAIKNADSLKDVVSDADKKAINLGISKGIYGFSKAISHLPGAVDESLAYTSAAQAMAQMYVSQGMDPAAASKKTIEEIIKKNFHVIDSEVLIPARNNPKNVRRFLSRQENLLGNQNLLVPPNVPDASREDYKKAIVSRAVPRTVGDWIMFYDQTGNPILNADKVKTDEFGNIINAEDAAIRYSIDNADAMGGGF